MNTTGKSGSADRSEFGRRKLGFLVDQATEAKRRGTLEALFSVTPYCMSSIQN